MDYLRRIANAEFPLVVTDMGEINCAAVLHAAGYVCADFDPLIPSAPAVIHSITALGFSALKVKRELPPPLGWA
ncbi:hypothetical protein APR50_26815 [Variovorax paradoxus]|jgi:hypothetical protein|uniref:hypothetical protein n=1 Tax=Variovorax paradoxus TaxID=34073 RepID=UPI0006E6C974|nr:hypothetical protein APR49_28605 [Variovorax paradoxus]KPV02652.1 hypothetical protein APR50_26815 [Variovorax paradoxus]KPV18680.1 hypothetical protein APR51_22820 [Variovorax paradoxus]